MQPRVTTLLFEQFLMTPLLGDTTALHDDNTIAVTHRAQTMGDDEHRPAPADRAHVVPDDTFGFVVQGTGRLVQNQDPGIGQQGPRDGDAKSFSDRIRIISFIFKYLERRL